MCAPSDAPRAAAPPAARVARRPPPASRAARRARRPRCAPPTSHELGCLGSPRSWTRATRAGGGGVRLWIPLLMLGACPAVCAVQALTTIEAFMTKHFDSNFKELPVALAAQELKAGTKAGKRVAAAVGEDVAGGEAGGMAGGMAAAEGAPTAKRTRINLSKLDRTFIDGYLDMYVTLSGNATGRARLFASILEAAKLVGTLGSDTWTTKVISDRLHNALKAHNKALAASAEAAEAEAAEAEAAEVVSPDEAPPCE
jgi:hypothetical protein